MVTRFDLNSYNKNGFTIIRRLLQPDVVLELQATISTIVSGTDFGTYFKRMSDQGPDDPCRTIKMMRFCEYPTPFPALTRLCRCAPIVNTARALLDSPRATWFAVQCILKQPGDSNTTPWHQDETFWHFEKVGIRGLTVWIPLGPVSKSTDTLWMLPGSHRHGLLKHANAGGVSKFRMVEKPLDLSQVVALEMEPGDVSFNHGNVVHGTRRNQGKKARMTLTTHYHTDIDSTRPFQTNVARDPDVYKYP